MARQVKDLLQARVKGGATVILTTHILEVAERMADRIGIIQNGRLVADGTLDELRAGSGEGQATLEDLFLELTGAGDRGRGRLGMIARARFDALAAAARSAPDLAWAWRRSAAAAVGPAPLAHRRLAADPDGDGGPSPGPCAVRHLREVPITPLFSLIAAAGIVVFFTLMLSQTLSAAVDALYERADLDLLFSSPMAPRRVLTVRFLAVSFTVFALFGMLATPILLPSAVLGHPAWLAAILVLFCISLAASGVGLLLAAGLFRLIGPRRTRTVGQVMAAVIGAAFFLMAQARNILGGAKTSSLAVSVVQMAQDPRLHGAPGLDWPLRAMLGQPLPLLAATSVSAAIFLLTANQLLGVPLRRRRRRGQASSAGLGTRRARTGGRLRFAATPFSATLSKELRLIARDPALIAQVLLRVLYMIPLGFVLLRQAGQGQSVFLPGSAAALSLLASQVAGSLSWITISAEDAPDLLSCAPTPTRDAAAGQADRRGPSAGGRAGGSW